MKSKLDIENLQEDFSCWQRFGGKLGEESTPEETEVSSLGWGGTVDRSGVSAAQGDNIGLHWSKDPRLAYLGYRGIFPSNTTRMFILVVLSANQVLNNLHYCKIFYYVLSHGSVENLLHV